MTDESAIVIFHNPDCGLSRRALDILEGAGHKPKVVEYLKAGWTREQLKDIVAQMKVSARDILRDKEALAAELGLLDPSVSDEQLFDAMVQHPVLVNRPIVLAPKRALMARPAEILLDADLL